ncbi:MAG: hypothetical protein ACKOWG_03395, partial [Planctomycetia bacterium]
RQIPRLAPGACMAARTSIYLDHAAATPLHPAVAEAIEEARATAFANPSSQHAAGCKGVAAA